MPQAIHISPIDNVVVALHPIAKGTLVEVDGLSVTALEDIPQGHKMAVKPIKNGENVIKYGFPIGHATADAAPGSWMHTHNVHTNLSGEVEYSYNPAPCCKESSLHARRGCLPLVLGLFVSLPGTFHQICAFLQKCDFPCVLFKKFKNPLVIFRQTWYVVSNKGISLDTNVPIFLHPAFVP